MSDVKRDSFGRFTKGNKAHSMPHTSIAKNKISLKKRGIKKTRKERLKNSLAHRGKKSYLWQGGITKENYRIRNTIEFRLWRESVFARDNFTCKKCGLVGAYLHAHHINNFADYPELRTSISNGITFCKNCHNKFHKIYGKKHTNGHQLLKFLESCK